MNEEKKDILSVLLSSEGQFVSGEFLSKELGISRTAVWKRIIKLKEEGYPIEAITHKGYRMLSLEVHYGRSGIQSLLQTQSIGHELKFFQTLDSTNNILKGMASEGAPHGSVVISEIQEKGRGRLGRNWMSSPNLGIWMSVLLRPELHPAMIQSLTLAAAVAVCRAIEPYTKEQSGIKWPNDILIDGRKVCGILTELSAEAERVSWVVVGMGINVCHKKEDFPIDLCDTATSVLLNSKDGIKISRTEIAARILNEFESIYMDYILNGPSKMLDEWKKLSVTIGKRVALTKGEDTLKGKVLDVGEDGRLIIELDNGSVKEIFSGEISLRNI